MSDDQTREFRDKNSRSKDFGNVGRDSHASHSRSKYSNKDKKAHFDQNNHHLNKKLAYKNHQIPSKNLNPTAFLNQKKRTSPT